MKDLVLELTGLLLAGSLVVAAILAWAFGGVFILVALALLLGWVSLYLLAVFFQGMVVKTFNFLFRGSPPPQDP